MNFLSNKLVTLEPYSLEDINSIYNWVNDLEINIYYPHNYVVSKDNLKRLIKLTNNSKEYLGFIIIENYSQKKIGIVELRNIDMIAKHCEIEIAIGVKNFHNKGIGENVLRIIHKYVFEELGINRIKLKTSFKNISMKQLASKLGYVEVGVLKNEWFINGCYHDVVLYAKDRHSNIQCVNNISEIIGNTPILKLNNYIINNNSNSNLYAKLEFLNPSGSIKDRGAFNILEEAFQRGEVKKNTTIVAVTSGNLGVSLAMLSSKYKVNILIVSPEESIPKAKLQIINALGAHVIFTPFEQGYEGAVTISEKICKENPAYFNCNQFSNKDNFKAHEKTTAKEIIKDLGENIDTIILAVGSGGTVTGIGKELKKYKENIKIIVVEPKECSVLSNEKKYEAHYILGIGPGFIPDILDEEIINEVITVSHEEAYDECIALARLEGMFCGMSSGAVMVAAKKYCKNLTQKEEILLILPDNGVRYYHDNSVFNIYLEKKFKKEGLIKNYYE
ncbi:MAG: pyridoxal-phosphate dependent enzyme [Sarcina sp.]